MKNMKYLMSAIIFALSFVGCEDNDKQQVDGSLLVGKWEFSYQTKNGNYNEIKPENYCRYDQVIEFFEDHTVIANNPCFWNQRVESNTSWSIKGNTLIFNYYIITDLSISPLIVSLTEDELVLEQMFGNTDVIRNVYKKTTKEIVDYASDIEGEYVGKLYYSTYYIPEKPVSEPYYEIDLVVTKKNWGNISVSYSNSEVFGIQRSIEVDSIQTIRYEDERRFELEETIGNDLLYVDGQGKYNIRNKGKLGKIDSDSLYLTLDYSKYEKDGTNLIERVKQYQRFIGTRKK